MRWTHAQRPAPRARRYNKHIPRKMYLEWCACSQVIFVGESQGGHIAASVARVVLPELLVFVSSVPDRDDYAALAASNMTIQIGWKARNVWKLLPTQFYFNLIMFRMRRPTGAELQEREQWL